MPRPPLTPFKRVRAALLLLLPLLASCLAAAANRERAQNAAIRDAVVNEELEFMVRALGGDGWEPVGRPERGSLEEEYDESDDVSFDISSSGQYAILGVCDGQCSDLDLYLYLDGARVGGDFEPDARPVVSFRADSGTRARVVVTAPGCEGRTTSGNWYCTYGVQLMGR